MKRKYGIPTKTLIALLLVVISFAMLLFPLFSISIEVYGQDLSIPDVVDLLCASNGMTRSQFEIGLQQSFTEAANELAEETGVILNAKKATKTFKKILDGGVSLLDAATISAYVGGLLKDIDRAVSLNVSDLSATERIELMTIGELGTKFTIAAVVLWIVVAALLITFVIAIIRLLTHRRHCAISYAVTVAVLFVATVVCVVTANNAIRAPASTVINAIEDILWTLDMGRYGLQSLDIFHLTAAPFIAMICAAAAAVLMSVRIERGHKFMGVDPTEITRLTKWTCSCGFQNKLGNAFCSACGQKRPEKPRCDCGAVIVPGTKFCGKCGKSIEIAEEIDIAYPPQRKCPRCGGVMESSICRRCTNVGRQYGKCERCGAPVYGNETICESCKAGSGKLRGITWNKPGDSDLV